MDREQQRQAMDKELKRIKKRKDLKQMATAINNLNPMQRAIINRMIEVFNETENHPPLPQ